MQSRLEYSVITNQTLHNLSFLAFSAPLGDYWRRFCFVETAAHLLFKGTVYKVTYLLTYLLRRDCNTVIVRTRSCSSQTAPIVAATTLTARWQKATSCINNDVDKPESRAVDTTASHVILICTLHDTHRPSYLFTLGNHNHSPHSDGI